MKPEANPLDPYFLRIRLRLVKGQISLAEAKRLLRLAAKKGKPTAATMKRLANDPEDKLPEDK